MDIKYPASTLDKGGLQSMPVYHDNWRLENTFNGMDNCADDKTDIEYKPQLGGLKKDYTTLGSFQKSNHDDLKMTVNEDSSVKR